MGSDAGWSSARTTQAIHVRLSSDELDLLSELLDGEALADVLEEEEEV